MILLLSKAQYEHSTDVIEGYLEANNADYLRINGMDLMSPGGMFLDIRKNKVIINHNNFCVDDVKVVFNRRWYDQDEITVPSKPMEYDDYCEDELVSSKLNEFLSLSSYFRSLFKKAQFIPDFKRVNKLQVLAKAKDCNIDIPETFICTNKEQLKGLKQKYGSIITKSIGDIFPIQTKDNFYSFYTMEISDKVIETCENTFFPSLIQNKIEKEYEVRVFYFMKKIYAMAIFSQSDDQTKVDFRHYNYEKPNRTVPYRIPEYLEAKIHSLMSNLGLNTGSLDFIYSEDEYYFLEVNPVGQFGMVAFPCGHDIHKDIALKLIEIDKNG